MSFGIGFYPSIEGFEKTGNGPADELRYRAASMRQEAEQRDIIAVDYQKRTQEALDSAASLRAAADNFEAAAKALLAQ